MKKPLETFRIQEVNDYLVEADTPANAMEKFLEDPNKYLIGVVARYVYDEQYNKLTP